MEEFLPAYFKEYARKTVTTELMRSFLEKKTKECLGEKIATEKLGEIDWKAWVEEPGLTPVIVKFEAPEIDEAKALADKYIADPTTVTDEEKTKFNGWFGGL